MRRTIVPRRLGSGDTVAVVSPSASALGQNPERGSRARAYLESLGLRVRLMENAAAPGPWAAGTGEQRAADIHAAFADPGVALVLAAIGGNHTNQVIPHLDFELIRAHPKAFQGYSDLTVLQWALLGRAGLGSLYGGLYASSFDEFPHVPEFTDRFLRAVWFGETPVRFEPASEWTDDPIHNAEGRDRRTPRRMRAGEGWRCLRPGAAEGQLAGGCLEIISVHLKGSADWLDLAGALLFLEAASPDTGASDVDSYLTDLGELGVFEDVVGLVWGRQPGVTTEEAHSIHEVVLAHTAASGIPVLADVDFGHTDPRLTLPVGALARLDAGARAFRTLEPALL